MIKKIIFLFNPITLLHMAINWLIMVPKTWVHAGQTYTYQCETTGTVTFNPAGTADTVLACNQWTTAYADEYITSMDIWFYGKHTVPAGAYGYLNLYIQNSGGTIVNFMPMIYTPGGNTNVIGSNSYPIHFADTATKEFDFNTFGSSILTGTGEYLDYNGAFDGITGLFDI